MRKWFGNLLVLVVWVISAANASAHPGHDLLSHGWIHATISPFHFAVLAGSGIAILAAAHSAQKSAVKKWARVAGVSTLIATVLLWTISLS